VHIAIIGAGNVGGAIGPRLAAAGHHVVYGVRAPAAGRPDQARIADAARDAEAVILAMPYAAAAETIEAGGGFAGKIVIDATNPLRMGPDGLGLSLGFETSGAEQIAALAPGAHVFKSFNQTGFENLADPAVYALRPAMFVAGDHAPSRPAVLRLVADAGFEAIDAGPLRNARLLEPLGMLWIDLALKRGQGRQFAVTVQRKG